MLPYHLGLNDILRIAPHSGGSKNLEAVQATHQSLQALGFSAEQIVRILAHSGGSRNIVAVSELRTHFDKLSLK